MQFQLKNGGTVDIRPPQRSDAGALLDLLSATDAETEFLARNPGELNFTVEQEAKLIRSIQENPHIQWFAAFYQGKLVGQSSALVPATGERYRHRGSVAFALRKDYWGLGIGGKMMEACLAWCRDHGCEQVELDVVAGNKRAMGMYRHFGFEVTGTKPRALKYPDGRYADEYSMIKYL